MIKSLKIARALVKMSNEGRGVDVVAQKFLNFTKTKGLRGYIEPVLKHLEFEKNKEKLAGSLKIILPEKSAALDDVTRQIKTLAKVAESVAIVVEYDKKIIGGFVSTYNGVRYDASFSNLIEKMKKNLSA